MLHPRYVAGMNGCEFARVILDDVGAAYPEAEDEMYLDKSPEYWAGWALAYYQMTLLKLSKALHCKMGDLLEPEQV